MQAAFQALAPEAEAVEDSAAASPEPAKTVADILGERAGSLLLQIRWMIQDPYKEGPDVKTITFDEDSDDKSSDSRPMSEIPEDLLVQLLQIARKGKSS